MFATWPVLIAAVETSLMFADTSRVPLAAALALRAISWVTESCWRTATDTSLARLSSSMIVAAMAFIVSTELVVVCSIDFICWVISSVALPVCAARPFTS